MPYSNQIIGRFAPSPTGRIHAGNIFAAIVNWLLIKHLKGKIVMRIEDLDPARSKPEYATQLLHDFENLGLTWDIGPTFQHNRSHVYAEAFEQLKAQGLIYPCFCTRNQIKEGVSSAPNSTRLMCNPQTTEELLQIGQTIIYPGTCANLNTSEQSKKLSEGINVSYRLKVPDEPIEFTDLIYGQIIQNLKASSGDFIISRSTGEFSYQLACVVDDSDQGINFVCRGVDLLASVPRQIYLQRLLGLKTPTYAHVPLFASHSGQRLAKRDKSAGYDQLLGAYKTPEGVIGHISYISGLVDYETQLSMNDLLKITSVKQIKNCFKSRGYIPFN